MINHGLAKVRTIQPRIDEIVALAIVMQCSYSTAMRFLGDCANKALDYYLRITPPALTAPAAEAFWAAISAARASILSLTDHDDPGSPSRLQFNADRVTELPLRSGGFGHTSPVVLLCTCCWIAHWTCTLTSSK